MSTRVHITDLEAALPLLARDAAVHRLGFLAQTFDAWVRQELLPPPRGDSGKWVQEALDEALDRLVRLGCQPGNATGRNSHFVKIPGCQRVWRKLQEADGAGHWLFYFRKTGEPLPGTWGSPEFMTALIEGERRLAREKQSTTGNASDPVSLRSAQLAQTEKLQSRSHNLSVAISDPLSAPTDCYYYLTPEELSQRWRGKVTPETLANWRTLQIGPPYNKFGKAVLYRFDLLEKWERKNLVMCDIDPR
jgi:hypothetical protein